MAERRAELFFAYLEEALRVLSVEAPRQFVAMREQLGPLAISIEVADAPPRRLCLTESSWLSRAGAADVQVSLTQANLDAFLRGELTLEQGLSASRLAIRGPLDDVLACLDALQSWLHGALRSPSAPTLHRRYLDGQDPPTFRDA